MTRRSSADVGFLLVGGYNVLGDTTEIAVDREAVLEETTVLGDADEQHATVGLNRATVTQNGFYNDATGRINDLLVTLTEKVMCVGHEGNVLGREFMGFAGEIITKYQRSLARGTLHKANATYQNNGVAEDGKIQHVHQAEAGATLNSASIDNGASSANGGAAYLQVSALTLGGYTNFQAKIQHSTDDSVWADLATFAVVTAAPAAERKTVAGTVNRYTRSTHAYNGAGSGQSATYMTGFKRN